MINERIAYRIDMNSKMVEKINLPKEYRLLGGRSLIAKLILDEVISKCNSLGPNNKL